MSVKRLFVDMDGVLAKFTHVNKIEELYEENYFRDLEPQMNVVNAVKLLMQHPDIDVHILSSVLDSKFARSEKREWLGEYLPEMEDGNINFVPYGKEKKDYIPNFNSSDVLLDDYSKNLKEWCPPGVGIKLMNGINGTHGTWDKERVDFQLKPQIIASIICTYMGLDIPKYWMVTSKDIEGLLWQPDCGRGASGSRENAGVSSGRVDETVSLDDVIGSCNGQKKNEYYPFSDGFFSYYVNKETGEKKFKLDKDDVLVLPKLDDLHR